MIERQPYNQGEYICDAYVVIDEENAIAYVRNGDNGINFDIKNLNREGDILSTFRLEMLKRGYRLGKFKPDYTTDGGYDVEVYERKA